MSQTDPIDPFLWLEDVLGEPALGWVRERNAHSQAILEARPEFEPIRAGLLEMMNAKERIPHIARRADFFYNFWQDERHKRGLWRRTTLKATASPNRRGRPCSTSTRSPPPRARTGSGAARTRLRQPASAC